MYRTGRWSLEQQFLIIRKSKLKYRVENKLDFSGQISKIAIISFHLIPAMKKCNILHVGLNHSF